MAPRDNVRSYAARMGTRRTSGRRRGAVILCLAVLALGLAAGSALAAASASTGEATNVTPISAVLTGTVQATQSGTNWFFEYGTSTGYGQVTPTKQVGPGTTQVSVQISGLTPGTTYHCRLVVNEGPYVQNAFGGDRTFTTPAATGAIATTGQATSITPTSAELNGVANPAKPGASWLFEYGTTTAYGHSTEVTSAGTGVSVVSAKVTGLSPRTTYHFRLVVRQGGSGPATSDGADASFTTAVAFGRATLRGHHLIVHRGRTAIHFKCGGVPGAICKGRVSLTTSTGSGRHVKKVACGTGRLTATAVHLPTVRVKLGGRCSALLARAAGHRLGARLRVVFGSQQKPLNTSVRLFGR